MWITCRAQGCFRPFAVGYLFHFCSGWSSGNPRYPLAFVQESEFVSLFWLRSGSLRDVPRPRPGHADSRFRHIARAMCRICAGYSRRKRLTARIALAAIRCECHRIADFQGRVHGVQPARNPHGRSTYRCPARLSRRVPSAQRSNRKGILLWRHLSSPCSN